MKATFKDEFGVEMLRWLDKNGNIWTAELEQVAYLGKEFFENMTEDQRLIHRNWSVISADDIAEPGVDENGNDYYDEYKKSLTL